MTKLSVFFLVLLIVTFAMAADTKQVTNRAGNCMVTVPSSWVIQENVGIAQSVDKKVAVAVSSPSHGLATLAEVAQTAPTLYPKDKVTKNSATEFEMEGTNQADKPNVYRAIPAGAKVCIAEITYQSGSADDARNILATLQAK